MSFWISSISSIFGVFCRYLGRPSASPAPDAGPDPAVSDPAAAASALPLDAAAPLPRAGRSAAFALVAECWASCSCSCSCAAAAAAASGCFFAHLTMCWLNRSSCLKIRSQYGHTFSSFLLSAGFSTPLLLMPAAPVP